MSVEIIECIDAQRKKQFVDFPYQLYKNHPYWVPPLKKDELNAISADKNPAFEFCDAKFWIAIKNGKVVGRVAGIINRLYNDKMQTRNARISRIEFVDDLEVSKALLDTVYQWAKSQQMTQLHGPLGFTNLDHQAVLIEGFDHLPSIASEYHLPYYQTHFDTHGYEKEMDWVEFRLKQAGSVPEKALKLNDMLQKRYSLKVLHFNTQNDMKAYAPKVMELLNTAFADLFSFVAMPPKLTEFYIDKYFNILNPKFVKIILDKEDQIIGFIISLPSLSEAMQKAKGKLFPFGWYYIMQALKKPKVVDLLLTGIHPDWQAQGISAILITELQKVMIEHGVEYVETTGIIETNDKAINHWKNYDHIQHKRKRCYKKAII